MLAGVAEAEDAITAALMRKHFKRVKHIIKK
jgi:hypothetical protein